MAQAGKRKRRHIDNCSKCDPAYGAGVRLWGYKPLESCGLNTPEQPAAMLQVFVAVGFSGFVALNLPE